MYSLLKLIFIVLSVTESRNLCRIEKNESSNEIKPRKDCQKYCAKVYACFMSAKFSTLKVGFSLLTNHERLCQSY